MGDFPRDLVRAMARRAGWVAAAVLLLAVLMAFRGPQGIGSLVEKYQEIRELQQQNAEKAREIQALRERIQRLEDSGSEQDLEIRKQLKLLRPGETTFLLPGAKSSDSQPNQ